MQAMILTSDLKRLIKSTAKFISKDENRPMLQYIQLDFDKSKSSVRAAAVDGYKMSVENASCCTDESFTAYIKPYLPVRASGQYTIIELNGEYCYIDIGGQRVGYRQPQGSFLNTDEVIKGFESTPVTFKIAMNEEYLLAALKSIQKESKLTQKPVVFEFHENYGPAIIKSKDGMKAILPCRLPEN
jgi:DNA polymerase III sliding clamp (beta) subunit (PCNA family)